ncbi:MAG: DUF3127 domain-containing protein [Bacteroidia bacterium]
MALEIQGKLMKIMEPVSGEGKNGAWTKQDFVIETFETYPKKVYISAWGDKIEQLSRFQPGQDIKASVNVESREYNEKWYTDLRVWKIDPAEVGSSAPASFAQPGTYQPQSPAPSAPAQPNFQTAPASSGNQDFFDNSGDGDDLPF